MLTDNPEQCWSPPLSRVGSAGHWQSAPGVSSDGDGADTVSPSSSTTLHTDDGVGACPGLRRETCGITACAPPASSCVESRPSVANAPSSSKAAANEANPSDRTRPSCPATSARSTSTSSHWDGSSVPSRRARRAPPPRTTRRRGARVLTRRRQGGGDDGGSPWRVTKDTARTRQASAGAIELRAGGPGAAREPPRAPRRGGVSRRWRRPPGRAARRRSRFRRVGREASTSTLVVCARGTSADPGSASSARPRPRVALALCSGGCGTWDRRGGWRGQPSACDLCGRRGALRLRSFKNARAFCAASCPRYAWKSDVVACAGHRRPPRVDGDSTARRATARNS